MSDDVRRAELRTFLQGRRARIRPEDVGLPAGARRRVPGLRREEVAALAGVGVTWYTMFETGTAAGVSSDVVDSVARALQLSPGERTHLAALASRACGPTGDTVVDPLVLEALHGWIDAPAYVITTTWDVLAWNAAYSYVWAIEEPGGPPFNAVLRPFVDANVRAMHGERWPAFVRTLVAMFRVGWAKHLGDDRYAALLAALREEADFVELWEEQDVEHPLADMSVTVDSPNVGPFTYDVLNLTYPASNQQTLVAQIPRGPRADGVRAALRGRFARISC